MNLNPCKQLNDKLEMKLEILEKIQNSIQSDVNDIINNIENYGGIVSDIEEITNACNDATVDAIGAGTDSLSEIENFTGSCLNDIFNKIDNIGNNIINLVSDAMDSITSMFNLPELPISKSLQNLKSLFLSIGIKEMIEELDRILGCLSDQPQLVECLTKISTASARIEVVLDNLNLSDTGEFEFDIFTSDLSASDSLLNNIQSISTKMSDLSTEVLDNISSIKPTTKVSVTYF